MFYHFLCNVYFFFAIIINAGAKNDHPSFFIINKSNDFLINLNNLLKKSFLGLVKYSGSNKSSLHHKKIFLMAFDS